MKHSHPSTPIPPEMCELTQRNAMNSVSLHVLLQPMAKSYSRLYNILELFDLQFAVGCIIIVLEQGITICKYAMP